MDNSVNYWVFLFLNRPDYGSDGDVSNCYTASDEGKLALRQFMNLIIYYPIPLALGWFQVRQNKGYNCPSVLLKFHFSENDLTRIYWCLKANFGFFFI